MRPGYNSGMESGQPDLQFHTWGIRPIGEDGMKCHGKNHDPEQADSRDNNKGGHGHLLMMIACCGLPILLIALLPLLRGIGGGWLDKVARYSFLLCPLMMIPMLFMNHGGSRSLSHKHVQEPQRLGGRDVRQITDQRE